jgi:hypothetical protein
MKPYDVVRPAIRQDWASDPTDGLQLELSAEIGGLVHALAAIVADGTDESLWFEVYVNGKAVQIPLAHVIAAISAAPGSVHSKQWLVANAPSGVGT